MRDDVDVLKPILARLTSYPELPVLLVGGKTVGTVDEVREMSKDGRLQKVITSAGAVVNGAKKKKGRKH
jgi:glutaredoxin-related protein